MLPAGGGTSSENWTRKKENEREGRQEKRKELGGDESRNADMDLHVSTCTYPVSTYLPI